ncbi:hypothetical protein ACLMJK_007699 [Lecanora helva]
MSPSGRGASVNTSTGLDGGIIHRLFLNLDDEKLKTPEGSNSAPQSSQQPASNQPPVQLESGRLELLTDILRQIAAPNSEATKISHIYRTCKRDLEELEAAYSSHVSKSLNVSPGEEWIERMEIISRNLSRAKDLLGIVKHYEDAEQ